MRKLSSTENQIPIIILALIAVSLACRISDAIGVAGEAAAERCLTVDRDRYERYAAELGQTPETPKYPESAVYEACYIDHELTSVRMSEGYRPEEEEEEIDEEEVDVCTLLPVDASMVTISGTDSCVADVDSLVGCGECDSKISITRMESGERAEQVAVDGNCGNPNFSARGESPIGSNGFTCTDTTGEEYREGVAQGYFYLSFSHRRYVVTINTGYPGMEDFVINLGRETIELIDDSSN